MPNQDYQSRIQKAEALFAEGRMQQALDAFLHLNARYPETAEVLNNIGVAYYTLGKPSEAAHYLQQAVQADPDFQEARGNLSAVQGAQDTQQGTPEPATKTPTEPEDAPLPEDHFPIKTEYGLTVCTPPSIANLTAYVLLEQEKWYEPELEFLRLAVRPEMTVVDVGAAFGVYTLPLAQAVGQDGVVYAFEPGSEARSYLTQSLATNRMDNVHLLPQALDAAPGAGSLQPGTTQEYATIAPEDDDERIELTSLDQWWQDAGKPNIDGIKIDVNGKERQVLQGAATLLRQQAPILLLRVATDGQPDTASIEQLQAYGYALYRYVPGAQAVTAAPSPLQPDPFLTKLVALKPKTAAQLAEQGLVVTEDAGVDAPPQETWERYIRTLPWSEKFMPTWREHAPKPENQLALQTANHLCAAQLDDTTSQKKFSHLLQAAHLLLPLFNSPQASGPVALNLARAFADLGLRSKAVQVLEQLLHVIEKGEHTTFNLPFLPQLPRFDHKPLQSQQPQKWIMACCLESFVAMHHFSGYFSGEQDQEILKVLHKNPEHGVGCERRMALLRLRNDNKDQIDESSLFFQNCAGNRNRWFWEQYIKDNHIRQLQKVTELPSELIAVSITLQNGSQQTIKIPRNELFRIKNVFQNNEYALPRSYKPPEDMTVVDIGANVGTFAIYAKQWAKNVHVYCYEPNSQVLNILKENLQNYQNVYQYPVALSDQNGEFNLYLHPKNTGQTSLTQCTEHCSKVKVPVKHAGESIKEIGLTSIDVLKIDTEGSEVQVIKAIKSILPDVAIVMLEYHSEKDRRIIDNLLNDFFLYDSSVMIPGVGTMKYYNKAILLK